MLEQGLQQLAISSSDNYLTQFTQDLPEELLRSSSIRQLDSLTLCNFKSFRQEHYVGPFLKFTSVIGPNGSGKSNILDALFFCICGERSKGHHTDTKELIYKLEEQSYHQSGVQQRSCWVQARFLLSDNGYITVKRQLLLSGESRYFINGREHPQKVYAQYLNSQGLLTEVCNFAIFQGQTDRLASIEPKDLRVYLEMLSGSATFKQAYDSDKQQLQRLDHIIAQNTGKVTRLKQEKKNIKQIKSTTTDYQKVAQKLTDIIQTQFAVKMLFKQMDIRYLQGQIDKQQANESKLQEEFNQKKAQLQRDYKQSVQLQAKLNELLEQKTTIATKLKMCNTHDFTIKSRQLSDLQLEVKKDREEENLLQAKLKILEESMPSVVIPQQLHEYMALYQRWQKQNFLLKTEVEKKQLNIAALDRSIIGKEATLNKMLDAKRKNEHQQSNKHTKVQQLSSSLSNIKASTQKIKDVINRANEEARSNSGLIAQKEEEIASVNQNLQDLENSILEGLEEVKLRNIFKKLMVVHGFKGRVADKIKPMQKKFNHCFSQMMAPIDGNLLAEDESSAKQLASKLKDLCTIKNVVILANIGEKDHNISGFRRQLGKHGIPAADIIDFDRELAGLQGYLMVALKGKVVCETLEDAFKLRELRLKTVKEIYTLDGNVLRDDGMISINGEFDKNRKTYRFDNDGQKKIEKEMAVLQKKKSELQEQIKKLKDKTITNAQLTGFATELNGLEKREKQLLTEIDFWRNFRAKTNTDHQFLQTELRELKLKREKLAEALLRVQKTMANSNYFNEFMTKHNIQDLSVFRNSKDMKELETNYQLRSRLNSEIEQINKRLRLLRKKDLQSIINKLQQQLAIVGQSSYRKGLEEELEGFNKTIQQLKQRLEQLTVPLEHNRFKSQLPELTERLKFLEIQKQLYQRELSETEGLNIVNPDYEKALKLIKEDINSVKREQLEDLLDKLDNDRKKIEDDLEKYNTLTLFNSGMANEMETVESRVKDLEDALDANIKSREVVKERLNTIGQKRSKVLVDFIEKLKIVLAEAYRILTETADYKVFGHADLYLENQQTPFMGGVYFSPTPPSKRFVYDIDQLSGGQKSLASIALQFSTAVATKSPFIMFDESDAFLDIINIEKLLKLIHRGLQADNMQFIVVSHKELVFSTCHSLVGAINQNKTSRAFSLRLDE